MNVDEFLMEMLRVFDMTLPCPPTKGTIFETLRSLVEREGTRGRQSVLAIDGAQRLSDEVLDLLPKQADAKSKGGSPLRVVLFAREELVTRLVDPGMRHLRRRITMTHCLQPLSSDEIGPYLVHRVAAAGSPGLISFSRGALERIYRASGGRARIVNVVSDRCLLMLRQPPRTTVTRRIVDQVLRDVGIHTVPKGKGSAKGRLTIVRLALASAVLALILCGSLIVLWPALGF